MAVTGYVRVSTERQTNEHWKMLIADYAQSKGLPAPQWVEEQVTGSLRPWRERKLAPWLTTCDWGDVLIVGEASRIGRNTEDALNFVRHAREAGITVHVIQAGQVITPDGEAINAELIITILFAMAKHERELLRTRIKLGLERARAEGKTLGGYRGRVSGRGKGGRATHPDKEKILQVVRVGASINGTAATFGVSRQAIYNWLKEAS